MPIMRPEVQEALRSVGLAKTDKSSLGEMLDAERLSVRDSIELLSDVAHGTDNGPLKIRALETALKLHGVLKDQPVSAPQVTIIINDPDGPKGINPILIPRREATADGTLIQ